jgi:hypothetical protein
MPETGPSGSMSGMWKRSMVRLVRHRQTKGPETDRPNLTHRATSRLHHLDSTHQVLAHKEDPLICQCIRSYYAAKARRMVLGVSLFSAVTLPRICVYRVKWYTEVLRLMFPWTK